MHRPGKTANTLNKINVHDLHEYSTFFLIGLVKSEITFEMWLFSGFDSHAMLSRFDGNRFIFPNHYIRHRKRLAAYTARRFDSAVRYCADTQQRIVSV